MAKRLGKPGSPSGSVASGYQDPAHVQDKVNSPPGHLKEAAAMASSPAPEAMEVLGPAVGKDSSSTG